MKIKRLELLGFKSFKDRTVIHFDDGITGIVGPNGCGKSNIVDALTWVMGEQSAKHLRGSSMEDVIFNGSENFSPLGLCEVSLTLANDGGPFPAKLSKFSEVMLTRRLHRSGDSEYFINKEPSRLKDIVDIFMDTGAGSKGFSIIEQGQIGKIITAKPDDRRSLIEEAAGITKFKARKKESQRKLESTEQNLVRLNDIIGELRRQLDSLQRQAKRAERYKELKTQAQELDLFLSSKKLSEIQQESQALSQRLEQKTLDEQEGQAKYAVLMADLQNLKLELLDQERKVNAAQSAHFEAQTQIQKKESEIKLLEVEIENGKKNEELAGTLKSEVAARQNILSRDLDHATAQMAALEKEVSELSHEALEKSEKSALAILQSREGDERLTQVRRDLMSTVQGLTTVEVKISSYENSQDDLARRLSDAEAVKAELAEKKSQFEVTRNKSFSALESQRQMHLSIMKDVENFETNLDVLKKQAIEKRAQVETFKDDLNTVKSRLYGLEAINNNFEGFQDGVKQIMTWQREKYERLRADGSTETGFELVADVVEVPKDYEMALEAALGDRLQSIISSSSVTSRTAVALLKEQKAGRSSFISKDLTTANGAISGALIDGQSLLDDEDRDAANIGDGWTSSDSSAHQISQEEGVRGLLTNVVRVPERHEQALAHILDGIVIVDDIATALKLRPRFHDFTFVTVDGDVLGRDGVLTGGSLGDGAGDSSVLKRKREIKELTVRRDEAVGKLALTQGALEKLDAQIASVSKDLEAAQKQSFEQEIQILDRKKDLERAEGELRNVDEALRRQDREVQSLQAQIENIVKLLASAKESGVELQARRLELETQGQTLEAEVAQSKSVLDELAKLATEAQVKAAQKSQEFSHIGQQKARLERDLQETNSQLARMTEDSTKNSSALNEHIVALEEARSTFNKLLNDVRDAEEALKITRNNYEIVAGKTRDLETQTSTLQRETHSLAQEIGEIQVKLSQIQINERYIQDQINERYMLTLSEIASQYADREHIELVGGVIVTTNDAQAHLDEFRDKLKKIGEVNLTAIQEYEELSQRYDFLTKQQQDLIGAMDSLRKVIDRINRVCNRRFRETFEAVNERFKKVFPVLFGGGEAELRLVEDPNDPHASEPGVEIMARPPGKKLQSVTLLSGGEKALTAVSLIFAIFLFKPSPFCLLDEVDAPLDDANVYRFNDLIKEMSKRSQIIIVTHNKHTMEINNKLYGVTMEDPGVSKMVSVQLDAADPATAP